MSVSSVDPPSTQKPPRPLELQHQLELRCNNASEATQALKELGQTQAHCAVAALGRLASPESQRLGQTLGSVVPTRIPEGMSLVADAAKLTASYERLCASYEMGLRELALQGLQALKNATRYTGRERQEELRDGLRLLKEVTDSPIGSRNFSVWFEVGWAQWMLGEAPETVADSFYHAARLAGSSEDLYLRHALRHLAYQQAALGKWGDAWATIQRGLVTPEESSPALWIEAARYALGAGFAAEAQDLLDKALDHHPESAFVVFSDPDLTPLYGACSQTVEKFAEAARSAAATELERLQSARQTKQYLKETLGIELDLPDPLVIPESLQANSLFEAHLLADAAHTEASQIFEAAITAVQKEYSLAADSARRTKIQIDQALSEKSYYEGSLRNIEEHATESGFSLHPYTFNNPFFRRRNQRAEDARFAYESFKQKLAQSEAFLQDHLPAMESVFDRHEQRRLQIEEVLRSLNERRGS